MQSSLTLPTATGSNEEIFHIVTIHLCSTEDDALFTIMRLQHFEHLKINAKREVSENLRCRHRKQTPTPTHLLQLELLDAFTPRLWFVQPRSNTVACMYAICRCITPTQVGMRVHNDLRVMDRLRDKQEKKFDSIARIQTKDALTRLQRESCERTSGIASLPLRSTQMALCVICCDIVVISGE